MSNEVNWVLDTLQSVAEAQPADHPLYRVDRDNSYVYETDGDIDMATPIQKRKGELEKANFVGASLADRSPTPVGTEYDHAIEAVVGVRIEGLTSEGTNWGHIDPDGTDGVAFDGLVDDIRRTLASARGWPAAGNSNTTYHTLQFANEAPDFASHRDFYRYDFDAVFRGYEDLP